MVLSFRKWDRRKVVADSIAFLLYTAYTGWIIIVYEKYFCDLAIEQVILLRLMSGMPRALLGFLCGIMEDAIERRMGDTAPRFLRRAAAGPLSLFSFQLPIYIVSALIMRASMEQMAITSGLYIAIDIVFGWSYAVVLARLRRCFGVSVEEQS